MSEPNTKSEVVRDPSDPLGFLIIPIFGVVLVAVLLLWLNQKKDEEEQAFFPVTGQITMNNKPLVGNYQISFYPADDSDTPIASSMIRDDGTYELLSGIKGIKGAMPGEYRVSVAMLEENEESFRMQGTDPKEIKINPKDGGTVVPPNPDPPFDKLFSDPIKTPQRAVVSESENRIDIDLPLPSSRPAKKKKANQDQQSARDGKSTPKDVKSTGDKGNSEDDGKSTSKNAPASQKPTIKKPESEKPESEKTSGSAPSK